MRCSHLGFDVKDTCLMKQVGCKSFLYSLDSLQNSGKVLKSCIAIHFVAFVGYGHRSCFSELSGVVNIRDKGFRATGTSSLDAIWI